MTDLDRFKELVGHTSGPWVLDKRTDTNIEGVNGRHVASAGGYYDNYSEGAYSEENANNAKLIAAAPCLLATVFEQELMVKVLVNALAGIVDELVAYRSDIPRAISLAYDALTFAKEQLK